METSHGRKIFEEVLYKVNFKKVHLSKMFPNIEGFLSSLIYRYNPNPNHQIPRQAKAGRHQRQPKVVAGVKAHIQFISGFYIIGLETPQLVLP